MGKDTADDRTTLISAKHGVYPSCAVPDTTPLSVAPESTTSTTAPLPPADTAPASSTTEAPTPASTADVQAVIVSQGEIAAAAARRVPAAEPLPATGFPVGLAVLGAVMVVLIGLALLAIARVRDGQAFG